MRPRARRQRQLLRDRRRWGSPTTLTSGYSGFHLFTPMTEFSYMLLRRYGGFERYESEE